MNSSAFLRTVALLRHAKSDWQHQGLEDHDRPLNARGRRSTPLIAQYIERYGIGIDLILSSTAVRAQQTLELLVATWTGQPPTIYTTPKLYLATPQAILREISLVDDQWNSLLVIGHNPGLEDLAGRLAKRPIEYPTACLTVFEIGLESWAKLIHPPMPDTVMTHYVRPRELS